ncbi:MAG TPA: HD domain-containing protein [Candidatus Binatia bacterium]|nr:HD domain-containing protein [Candidatus Binatia bacterium]
MKTETVAHAQTLFAFLREMDKYTAVLRQIWTEEGRQESDAEHSWQLAMMLLALQPHLTGIDLHRALKMALVHDLPELYCGDVFTYDEKGREGKKEREAAAAEKLFGKMPGTDLHALWIEFEANETPEAKIVQALDKLHPILQNTYNGGKSWRKHGITLAQIRKKKDSYMQVHPVIQELYEWTLREAQQHGLR